MLGPPRTGSGGTVNAGPAIEIAVTFVWLGMVLAISFLEAPLKFRAPNVTLQIGLGIGRLVFRALNAAEVVFALVIGAIVVAGPTPVRIIAVSGRRRPGRATGRRSSETDPPDRPGAGRAECPAVAFPLHLRGCGGGQGGRVAGGGDTAAQELTSED